MMSIARQTRIVAGIAAGSAAAIGFFGVATWWLDARGVRILPPDYVLMSPVTGALLALLGSVFTARVVRPASTWACHAGVSSAALGVLVGMFALAQYRRPIPLPWEIWLLSRELVADRNLSFRMSPLAAGVLILSCLALFARSCPRKRLERIRWVTPLAAGLGLVTAAVVAVGYLANPPLIRGGNAAPMAFLTASGFVALNLAILLFLTLHEVLTRWREREKALGGAARARLRGILFAWLLGFIAVTVGWLYYLRSGAIAARESVHGLLDVVAKLQVSQIAEWRRERLSDGQLLVKAGNIRRDIEALRARPGDKALRAKIGGGLDALRNAYNYESATIFNPQGKVLLTTPDSLPLGIPQAPDGFAAAARSEDPTLTDLHQEPGTRAHLDLLAPIRSSTAGLVAVVNLRIDPRQHLFPLLANWPATSDSGESILLRPDGDESVYLSELRYLPGASLNLRRNVSELDSVAILAGRGDGALQQGVDYRGAVVVFASRPVPGANWVLEAKVDEAEAFAPARREARLVTAMMALLLFAIGLAGLVVWRQREAENLRRSLQAEREHRAISDRLALISRHANDVVFMFDEGLRIIEASDRVNDFYGRTPEEMRQLSLKDLWPSSEAEKLPALFEGIRSEGSVFEGSHVRRDGSEFPVEVSARPVTVDGRRYMFSIVRDVAERRRHQNEIVRLSQLYAALMHVNQAIVHAADRASFLNNVCQVLVESGGFLVVWIGQRDAERDILVPVAQFGDTTGYIDRSWRTQPDLPATSSAPVATSLRENRMVVSNDFLNDPTTAPWHEAARSAGVRAAISLPLRMPGGDAGALCAYAPEEGFFGDEEILLLKQAAADIVFGLDNLEREAARRKADEDLHTSLREKEALLKEVHHRVGNNLQVILSLLRLESNRAGDPAARAVLKEMQGRIHSMAQLHETIYRSGNFARVELRDYLQRLSSGLVRLHGANAESIRVIHELSSVSLDIDRAIPCGLIVNELVTNSLKHAFPNGGSGEIRVVLQRVAEGRILMEVSDNGIGLAEDFETRRKKSLGLQLVFDLARQIKGELEVRPEGGSGVRFRVTFAEGAVMPPRYPLPA